MVTDNTDNMVGLVEELRSGDLFLSVVNALRPLHPAREYRVGPLMVGDRPATWAEFSPDLATQMLANAGWHLTHTSGPLSGWSVDYGARWYSTSRLTRDQAL